KRKSLLRWERFRQIAGTSCAPVYSQARWDWRFYPRDGRAAPACLGAGGGKPSDLCSTGDCSPGEGTISERSGYRTPDGGGAENGQFVRSQSVLLPAALVQTKDDTC